MFEEKFFIGENDLAPLDDVLFLEKKKIALVVSFQEKYLIFEWKKSDIKTLVIGEVASREILSNAVKRVLEEETGYYKVKREENIQAVSVARFFDSKKGFNKEIIYYPYFIELEDLDQLPKFKKNNRYKATWITSEEINESMFLEHQIYMFNSALDTISSYFSF